jgi:hypothetical protein
MASKALYFLTSDEGYQPKTNGKVWPDYMGLVERFKDADDELMIPGGWKYSSCLHHMHRQ